MTDNLDMMTVAEIAKMLRVANMTVYRWVETGALPSLRLPGRTIRFRRSDVLAFIAAHTHGDGIRDTSTVANETVDRIVSDARPSPEPPPSQAQTPDASPPEPATKPRKSRRRRAPSADSEVMSAGEVAALFGSDPKTVVRWAKRGLLPSFTTPGGHHRFRRSEMLSFLRPGGTPNG